MSKKYRIIKCINSYDEYDRWYEVERKGLLFWSKEEQIIGYRAFVFACFTIYGDIKFTNIEEARKYISERMPTKPDKKENKSRIIRIVYDIITLK